MLKSFNNIIIEVLKVMFLPWHNPFVLLVAMILIIIIFGTICSLLASLWPTNIASRVKPAEALRYE